jgi:hypothetical protein
VRKALLVAVLLAAGVSACGGSSSPSPTPTTRSTPDLAAFLALPVATPSACPSTANGQSAGRPSPWAGTVDVSVFVRSKATVADVRALGRTLRNDPLISKVYFESRRQAYREFQRLYKCWSSVPRSLTPASYRLVLVSGISSADRDRLVGRLAGLDAVDGVSCDASVRCLAVVGTGAPPPS